MRVGGGGVLVPLLAVGLGGRGVLLGLGVLADLVVVGGLVVMVGGGVVVGRGLVVMFGRGMLLLGVCHLSLLPI